MTVIKKNKKISEWYSSAEMIEGREPLNIVAKEDKQLSNFMRPGMLKIGAVIHRRRLQNGWSRSHVSILSGEVMDSKGDRLLADAMTPAKIEAIEEYGFSCEITELMVLLDLMGVTDDEINRSREL